MTDITLPRAELQQVLEAMENFGTDWDGWHRAYMALRERLAQPEQEPVAGEPLPCPFCGNSGLDFDEGSTYRWGIASCSGCGASCGEIRREYPDKGEWHKEAIAEWNRRASPPAQRKPLTDERIGQIIEGCKITLVNYCSDYKQIEFARAIEAAHGIKGGA